MYGLVKKGTKELLMVEVHNGPEEGEITHGPWFTISDDIRDGERNLNPFWTVGNYDVALRVANAPKKSYRKSFMYDGYEIPELPEHLCDKVEVVEVTLTIK